METAINNMAKKHRADQPVQDARQKGEWFDMVDRQRSASIRPGPATYMAVRPQVRIESSDDRHTTRRKIEAFDRATPRPLRQPVGGWEVRSAPGRTSEKCALGNRLDGGPQWHRAEHRHVSARDAGAG